MIGLWLGLSLGLAFCGIVLLAAWIQRTRHDLPPDARAPELAEML